MRGRLTRESIMRQADNLKSFRTDNLCPDHPNTPHNNLVGHLRTKADIHQLTVLPKLSKMTHRGISATERVPLPARHAVRSAR
jgi:hypothetical protein